MEAQISFSYRPVQYLAITQNWKSNLENFDSESEFLHLLFEDYFVNFFSKFFTANLKALEARLVAMQSRGLMLKNKVIDQLLMVNMQIEGKVKENSDYLKKKQVGLEIELDQFNKDFAALKKDIYQLFKLASDGHERFSYPCIDKLV